MRQGLIVLSALAVLLGAVPGMAQRAPYAYDVVTVTLPRGNPQAGRQAFRDLKCYVCHRVEGETTFPPPVGEALGPDLERSLSRRPASDVAAAIIVPSHSVSVKVSAAVKKRLEQLQLSPMGDYSRVLTVRQLADLLAYLGLR
jgi:mono/diheme cytochrome c family protein